MNKKKEIEDLREWCMLERQRLSKLEWKCKHLEELIKLILNDLTLEVVYSPSQIKLKNTYETGDPHGSHHQGG